MAADPVQVATAANGGYVAEARAVVDALHDAGLLVDDDTHAFCVTAQQYEDALANRPSPAAPNPGRPNSHGDPVEFAARGMYDTPTPSLQKRAELHAALTAIHAAGWRLVRTDYPCALAASKHTYGDRHPLMDRCIVDEWTPAAGAVPAEGQEPTDGR